MRRTWLCLYWSLGRGFCGQIIGRSVCAVALTLEGLELTLAARLNARSAVPEPAEILLAPGPPVEELCS